MLDRPTIFEKAFSIAASEYDAVWNADPAVQWLRTRAHVRMESAWSAGNRILELNCGTGEDAITLAQRGVQVVATDISHDMVQQTREKVASAGLSARVETKVLDFSNLHLLRGERFDGVLSMMGGLNCAANLDNIARDIASVLKPGGTAIISVMPRIALWEVAANLLRGHVRTAFRRWHSTPVLVNVYGIQVPTHYWSVSELRRAFSPYFRIRHCESWNAISPPPASRAFRRKYPRVTSALAWLELHLAHLFPFNRIGDHIFLELVVIS